MKVLLALCLLSCGLSVLAFPTLQQVPPQCADPTFACQDLESARLCGVVSSCIHDIWATMSAPDDNDEICDICKEMVKEARDQLLSNMTQEEIKEVFEGSCNLIPVKLIADGCIKIVDEIIPELVEMLASRMDPNMVCTVSGLCNMAHLPLENHILKILHKVITHADQCTECTTMMSDVKTFMTSMSEADMKVKAEKICYEKAPHYLCDILLSRFFPEIYDYVSKTDPKIMCTQAGVCKQTCGLKEHVGDELVCEFCTHVLEHIKEEIIANTTVEEFRTALLNFCKQMGSFSDKCTSLVNDYYDMIFDYIRKLDTKGLCTLIGLCTNNDTLITPLVQVIPPLEMRKSPLIRLQPANRVGIDNGVHPLVKVIPAVLKNKKEMAETNDIFPNQDINALPLERFTPVLNFERDTECAFCKAITFYLQQDLQGDRSKLGIRKAMNKVCDKWVKEFPVQCESFLNKYSQKVEYAIAEDVEYETMCTLVKACPLEDTHSELEVRVLPNTHANAGPFCDLCKELMTQVENKLKDPNTETQVKALLGQACNVLPGELRDACTDFVSQNVDALFTILQQELTPDNICPALKFCTAIPRITAPQPLKDLECDLCKELVTNLRQEIQNPEVKTSIVQFLDEACSKLPGDLAKECQSIINNNIDVVIGVIIRVMDPDTVCSIVKVCPGQVKAVKPSIINDIECDLCEEVVEKVLDIVKDKKTEDEIKMALDKVCGLLPSSISDKCKTFIDEYTEVLITLIAQEMSPEMICAALNICPTKENVDELQTKAQDLECQSCQYALHFLQQTLMSADTQDKVKNVLKQMCSILPDTYAKNCESFVDEYGNAFLALLAQELDPNTICWEMKMCHNQTRIFKVLSIGEIHSVKNTECDICTQVVNYLDQLLENDDVDKEIATVVEKVCTIVPVSVKDECSTIIETYGVYILQMIGQMADSKQICQDIDLCARPHGHAHLLGGSKCTFGPSYWCQSNAHAAACKAEMFCKQRVWQK